MHIYIGCYTKKISSSIVGEGTGISIFDFNELSGDIKPGKIVPALNPSYLALSRDHNTLYAVEETLEGENPKIRAFMIKENGNELLPLNLQPLPASFACHITVYKDHLLVAGYGSGNILVYPLNVDGSLEPATQNIYHQGSGPNPERQEGPHVHMVYGKSNLIYVADLGIDTVKVYKLNAEDHSIAPEPELDFQVDPGAGARHFIVHPSGNFAFVMGELTGDLFVFKMNKSFEKIQKINALPLDYEGIPSGAAIKIHPNGRFIYVSNRGFEAITIFEFDLASEKVLFIDYQSTFGNTPRDFEIDPTGKWLVVANQDSHSLVTFSVDAASGLLKKVNTKRVKSPSCVIFK